MVPQQRQVIAHETGQTSMETENTKSDFTQTFLFPNYVSRITLHVKEKTQSMEKLAYVLIFVGAIFWVFSIFAMQGRWQAQLLAAVILIVGIIIAHVWEELFREKK